ncbi:MAG TPA: hypothetical protein VFH40_10085 [Gemmatimonadales bacterium]|nr:hypothetical protein [Gemmatimonadales bacterium]
MTAIDSHPDRFHRGRHYLLGMGALALFSVGFLAFAPPDWRPPIILALGLAMAVQVPLGSWLLATLGTDRFLPVWVLGMLVRLVLIALAGLLVFPALHWPTAPGLITLVLLLMASLALEGLVLVFEFREPNVR